MAVTDVVEYPKVAFPAEAVYDSVHYPTLRLITCGGAFGRVGKEYRGNVVVYAVLTGADPNR